MASLQLKIPIPRKHPAFGSKLRTARRARSAGVSSYVVPPGLAAYYTGVPDVPLPSRGGFIGRRGLGDAASLFGDVVGQPFNAVINPASYSFGDVDSSGNVTVPTASGPVQIGQLDNSGQVTQTATQAQAATAAIGTNPIANYYQQTPPPSSPNPPKPAGIEGWLAGNTVLFGTQVPNVALAAGGGVIGVLMITGLLKGRRR